MFETSMKQSSNVWWKVSTFQHPLVEEWVIQSLLCRLELTFTNKIYIHQNNRVQLVYFLF